MLTGVMAKAKRSQKTGLMRFFFRNLIMMFKALGSLALEFGGTVRNFLDLDFFQVLTLWDEN